MRRKSVIGRIISTCHRIMVICAVVLSTFVCVADDAPEFEETGQPQSSLTKLVDEIERRWSAGIERDQLSNVVSVTLPVAWAIDGNLRLLGTSSTLKSLTVSYNTRLHQPTWEGFSMLRSVKGLRSLKVICSEELPAGYLDALTNIVSMEKLTLVAASPRTSESYAILNNVPALQDLEILWPTRFGKDEIRAISGLTQLRRLSIYSRQLKEADCVGLLSAGNWSELAVDGYHWKMRLTRTRR